MPVADAKTKPTVEVATDELPDGYVINYAKRRITVPSPTLLTVPVELTEATVLHQSVVYPLTSLAATEFNGHHSDHWTVGVVQWWSVVEALRLWEVWEDGGPLAVGREDVLRWLYQNSPALDSGTHKALPEGYERICRTYHVWGLTPVEMTLPIFCSKLDDRRWSHWVYPHLPDRLGQLAYVAKYHFEEAEGSYHTVATATVIDYVVDAYGRGYLPRLLAALGEHESWYSLIPTVFDISAAEFEAGWQTYLADRYGVTPDLLAKSR